jgi:hypothetical protein
MVSEADMKKIIDHWKRGIRALRLPEQRHGEHLVHLLEHANGSALKHFDDYLEAATFALFLGLFGIWTSYARGKSSTTG